MSNGQAMTNEAVLRGEEIYEGKLRDQLEAAHHGRYVAIDVDTGQFEIADDMLTAIDLVKAHRANASIYVVRIGHPSAVKLGNYRTSID